jgi:ABC-type Fe3+-hydroxamate transport system substrate-binding protein
MGSDAAPAKMTTTVKVTYVDADGRTTEIASSDQRVANAIWAEVTRALAADRPVDMAKLSTLAEGENEEERKKRRA